MKSFKEYRDEKNSKNPSEQAYFGTHSRPKGEIPSEQASFGSHSNKTRISEDAELEKKRDEIDSVLAGHGRTKEQTDHIHENVAPIRNDDFNLDQRDAVDEYTDESGDLNNALHRHHQGKLKKSPHFAAASTIDSVLNNHKTTEDTHVFTGIKFSPAKHFRKTKDGVPTTTKVDFPAFTSTSTSLSSAREFSSGLSTPNDKNHGVEHDRFGEARHVLKINVPKGTNAMSLKKVSYIPHENEVLLHRGHTLEIHHQPQDIGDNTYLWNAHVVGHKLNDLSKPVE